MKIIEVTKAGWERRDRNHHAPEMIGTDESVKLIDSETGEVIAFQVILPEQHQHLKRELGRWLRFEVKYDSAKSKTGAARLSGMNYESRVFGYTAPQPLRRRYGVSDASFNNAEPEAFRLLEEFTKISWDLFCEVAPEKAGSHLALTEGVHQDWRIAGAPFTSGIINNTAALPYHKDSMNIKGTWNNMLGIKDGISGGGLHLPEYDVCFCIPDGSISGFDGQAAWHGVTPFVKKRNDAYRFTIVWYTKAGIVDRGSREEEAQSAKVRATK